MDFHSERCILANKVKVKTQQRRVSGTQSVASNEKSMCYQIEERRAAELTLRQKMNATNMGGVGLCYRTSNLAETNLFLHLESSITTPKKIFPNQL